jgi:hypothetical protein
VGAPHYTAALDDAQQQHARAPRDLFAKLAFEAEPATRGEIAALTAEVRALRDALVQPASVILTGVAVREAFDRLRGGACRR